MLFDEDKFYDRKLIWFTAELIKELDKAIKMVEVLLETNIEDI